MSEIQVLKQFKQQLISFFDELISQFREEPDLYIIRIFLDNQIPIKDVMEIFIHRTLHARDMIRDRNEEFILKDGSFFADLSKDKVNHFKKLWRSGQLYKEDKIVVWKWIDSFMYLADKYQKIMEKQ